MKPLMKILSTSLLVIILASLPLSALDYRRGANDASPAYASSKYYSHLSSIPLTGDGATDALAVALSQLGYAEGGAPNDFSGMGAAAQNYTEYNYNMGDFGIGFGGLDYHWCASFVSFCLYQSRCHDYGDFFDCARFHEGDTDYIWREISCQYWVMALRGAKRFYSSSAYGGTYTPKPGDLIFFTRDKKTSSHIGLVLDSEASVIYTVEGNTSSASGLEINGGGVYTKSYKASSTAILGFGVLPYKTKSIGKPDYSGKTPSAGYYMSKGVKYLYLDSNTTKRAEIDLPKYTLFHVSRVASGKGLSAVLECEYMGKTYYIKNNTDRIYQLTREEEKPAVPETSAETTRIHEVKYAEAEKITESETTVFEDTSETETKIETTIEYRAPETTKEVAREDGAPKNDFFLPLALSSLIFTGTLTGTLCISKKE